MSFDFDPNKTVPSVTPPGSSTTIDPNKVMPHVVSPEGAIEVGKAEGEFGDKVGVAGFSVSNFGVYASSEQGVGLFAVGSALAAQFEGSVTVNGNGEINGTLRTRGDHIVDGDIQLTGEDFAEDFDLQNVEGVDPGTVMVLDDHGGVRMSDHAYDRRVAGVVSGAGSYKTAVILGRQAEGLNRRPLALMGKVYCMVDASNTPIAIGDLLTTSDVPGHAMKAADIGQAFGAVIGKALRPLASGRGLVPILVALQ